VLFSFCGGEQRGNGKLPLAVEDRAVPLTSVSLSRRARADILGYAEWFLDSVRHLSNRSPMAVERAGTMGGNVAVAGRHGSIFWGPGVAGQSREKD
jgi:hypothetical protein